MNREEFEFNENRRQEAVREQVVRDSEKKRIIVDVKCYEHEASDRKAQQVAWEKEDLRRSHPNYAIATIGDKICYLLMAFVPIIAVVVNILLIYQPAEYLVNQSVKNPFLASILVLFVPVLFVLMVLAIATLVTTIKDEEGISLRYFNRIVVWITPTLLLATNIAHYRNQGSFEIQNLLLVGALFTLALITDSILVKGARQIRVSWGFIWYSIDYYRLDVNYNRLKLQSEHAFLLAGETFDSYATILKSFNDNHPEAPIIFPPLNETSERVIRKWLARKYAATNQ
ncbi:MAG: hypothetical protein AAFQ23_00130 [Cyanobacteria bacterium J06623_1]